VSRRSVPKASWAFAVGEPRIFDSTVPATVFSFVSGRSARIGAVTATPTPVANNFRVALLDLFGGGLWSFCVVASSG